MSKILLIYFLYDEYENNQNQHGKEDLKSSILLNSPGDAHQKQKINDMMVRR
jgi:hypothetical protein